MLAGLLCMTLLVRRYFPTARAKYLNDKPTGRKIIEKMDAQGFLLVVLFRNAPIPIALQNYTISMSRCALWKLHLGTLVGFAPSLLLYAWAGTKLEDVGNMLGGRSEDMSASEMTSTILPIVSSIVLIMVQCHFL